MCKSVLVFHCNYVCLVAFLIYSALWWRALEIWITGSSRSLEMAPICRSHRSFDWHSVVTMVLSCIISEIKRDVGRKSRFLHTTPVFEASFEWPPLEYCHRPKIWCGKLEWCGYPTVKKVWWYIKPFRHSTGVCRMDKRTDMLRHHSPRYA